MWFDFTLQVHYEKSVKLYHSSPAFVAFVAAKNKTKAGM